MDTPKRRELSVGLMEVWKENFAPSHGRSRGSSRECGKANGERVILRRELGGWISAD
jgi:hypothetical protein